MRQKGTVPLLLLLALSPLSLAAADSVASVVADLHRLAIDPSQTYRVRDLQISRGDIKIYLTEGTLAFTTTVAGKMVGAVFTTANAEVGDAEILVLPPNRGERASLAAFAKTPNLDEHFSTAVLFFSDETAKELRAQIEDHPLHPDPEQGKLLAANADNLIRSDAGELDVRIAQSLLDNHTPDHGFFYGIIGGTKTGFFDVVYEPTRPEPVLIGHISKMEQGVQFFQVWCSFRPRRKAAAVDTSRSVSDYRVDTVIHPDLSMASEARFVYRASPDDGRVINLELSSHLRVSAAQIDGRPAEFLQHQNPGTQQVEGGVPLLLLASEPLAPDVPHSISLSYQGSVVFRTAAGNYFVDERNTWYPFLSPMLTTFDLTFHCPETLRVVATGELLSDEVAAGVRTVHRKTQMPEPLAGFNLGNYESSSTEHGPYRIELFTNKVDHSASLPDQAAGVLDYYTALWQPLGMHTLAISPIEGYFGQGFPGLIYLSNITYIREEDRPEALRNARLDSFFSQMLLPHEIAHQWWGNLVSPSDYRSAWLFEAMSNYAALEYLEHTKGRAALDDVLESYRQDLLAPGKGGATVESAGPVDFGQRLLENSGAHAWHAIIYEKGAWIMHMLRMRLGDEGFHALQARLLSEFQNKQVNNEDFRRVAASLVAAGQPDQSLTGFFENWIYATGLPQIKFQSKGSSVALKISGVDDGFSLDLPLSCVGPNGTALVVWMHAGSGDNSLDVADGAHSCQLPKPTEYLYSAAF